MTLDDSVPATHPFPAYIDITDHDEMLALYETAGEQKYKAMVANNTLPKLQSELDEIVSKHCGLVVYGRVRTWLQTNNYMKHVDVTTWEGQMIVRIAFDSEQRRAKFLAAFPQWSSDPQGWIWGALEGENKLDVLIDVKKQEIDPQELHHRMIWGAGTGSPINRLEPVITYTPFEIANPPEEVVKYLKEKAAEEDTAERAHDEFDED